jgi:hypothetical protein
MANSEDGKGGKPDLVIRAPTNMVKVGVSHKGGTVAPEATTLRGGPPMEVLFPQLDLKTVQVFGYEPALKLLDLKDKKQVHARLRQQGRAAFTLEIVVGRDKPQPVSLTQPAGAQLAPVLFEAAQRAVKEPRLEPHSSAVTNLVRDLADASGVSLGGPARAVTSAAAQAAMGQVAFGNRPGSSWSGFSKTSGTPNAPLARPPPVVVGSLEEVFFKAAPGMDLDTLRISNVIGAKGFVLFTDGREQELALQQTKFSQPPMFAVEFRAPGDEPQRSPVLAPLARQVAAIISFCNENDPPDEVAGKTLANIRTALLKVV